MRQQLINLNKNYAQADFSWLSKLEKIIVKKFNLKKQISIALIDDKTIRELNRVYRKKNKVTDVLSFVINDNYILGEVLISVEQARRQADTKQASHLAELQLLTTHGILHLLGYDHEKSQREARRQEDTEKQILEELNK